MKKRNTLALALAAGLVLGGANTAFAEGWEDPNTSDWEKVAEKLDKEKEENKDLGSEWEDPNKSDWEKVAEELEKEKAEQRLAVAKKEAIEAIKEAGVTSDYYVNLINKGKTVESVNALRDQIIKAHEDSKVSDEPRLTIDEWNLKEAKKEAIEELKAAGITSDFYFDRINRAKTIEGVNALKDAVLETNKKDEEDIPPVEAKNGFKTRREAEIAAREALENDPVNNSYTVSQGSDGLYYYTLSPVEEGLEIGYETKEEAIAAAKEALENDPINNAFDVSQGADGRYYFTLKNVEKDPEVKPEDPSEEEQGPKLTIDEWLLKEAKKEAIEELKAAGITGQIYFDQINNAKTVEGVEALKAEILKAHEDSKEEEGPKVTIDEWLLKEAKKEAIEELKKAGITGQIYFDQINNAKTVEGVEALKNAILDAHKSSEEKPGKDDDKKPGEDDKKPGKDDKKPGYATREEAEEAAKKALENNKTKDSYTIFEDENGRFGYYLWSSYEEEEAEKAAKAKEANKDNKKANQENAQASNPNRAPKTGVAGMSAVAGLAAVSVAGILATRKKED